MLSDKFGLHREDCYLRSVRYVRALKQGDRCTKNPYVKPPLFQVIRLDQLDTGRKFLFGLGEFLDNVSY